jgi:hypothetical protein
LWLKLGGGSLVRKYIEIHSFLIYNRLLLYQELWRWMKMANKFEIPPRLEEILEENDTFSGFVKSSLGEFSPWLG